MKSIVIVNSTFRRGGNSETLATEFARGAREAGHRAEIINLRELSLKFCIGCMYCQSHEKCVLNDDINALLSGVQNADVLVFATPVYYYEMAGQLKTFLDRMNPLYPRVNKFKDVYLLAASADGDTEAMSGAVKGVQGWIDCFDGVALKGVVCGVNATDVGDIQKTDAPRKAYEMGKCV